MQNGMNTVVLDPLSMISVPAMLLFCGLAWSLRAIRRGEWQRLHTVWAFFGGSIVCFTLSAAIGDRLGAVSTVVTVLGSAGCGASWLLARALFRPAGTAWGWPSALVAALVGTGAVGEILSRPVAPVDTDWFFRMAQNAHSLTSSAVLLLALVEAIDGYGRSLLAVERRFREGFVAVYGLLLTVSVLWLRQAGAAEGGLDWSEAVRVACAACAFLASLLAVWFRTGHPLVVDLPATSPLLGTPDLVAAPKPRTPTGQDYALANRITGLLREQRIYTDPNLKVADLATRLGEPEYRITQSITGALGQRNFNRLVNRYRIDEAKRMLVDPRCSDYSILAIAMDCGFGSIGPFNRAFKEDTGVTPGAYRTGQRPLQEAHAAGADEGP